MGYSFVLLVDLENIFTDSDRLEFLKYLHIAQTMMTSGIGYGRASCSDLRQDHNHALYR